MPQKHSQAPCPLQITPAAPAAPTVALCQALQVGVGGPPGSLRPGARWQRRGEEGLRVDRRVHRSPEKAAGSFSTNSAWAAGTAFLVSVC